MTLEITGGVSVCIVTALRRVALRALRTHLLSGQQQTERVMERATLTPEDDAELRRLLSKFDSLTVQQGINIQKYGMDSSEFRATEQAISDISRRIRQIRGIPADQDWRTW